MRANVADTTDAVIAATSLPRCNGAGLPPDAGSLFPSPDDRARLTGAYGPATERHVIRDGMRDLLFPGWRIAYATHPMDAVAVEGAPRLSISVWAVERPYEWRSLYVVQISRDLVGTGSSAKTHVVETEADVMRVIAEDNGGTLGRLGKQVWDQCCRAMSTFVANECEYLV